jgi:uncharacterized alpha-E superfamily protein
VRLLSSNAEALFWLARYLERGASLARVIEMYSSYGGQQQEGSWSWLLTLYADDERFRELHEPTSAKILGFYTLDAQNAGSIRSSIHWARENARTLRPFIPLEMWAQLNAFHSDLEKLGPEDIEPAQLARTCARIQAGCSAQIGVAEGTLYRDEGHLFFRLGLQIERADQTSRLLDVRTAQAAAALPSADPSNEFVFWSTILRTAAAFQVFRRLENAGSEQQKVARFLAFNPSHPRSIGFCVREIGNAFQVLRGAYHLGAANACLDRCEQIMAGLQAASEDARFADHLHAFNDWIQQSVNALTADIGQAFFGLSKPADEPAPQPSPMPPGSSATQSQSQSQGKD